MICIIFSNYFIISYIIHILLCYHISFNIYYIFFITIYYLCIIFILENFEIHVPKLSLFTFSALNFYAKKEFFMPRICIQIETYKRRDTYYNNVHAMHPSFCRYISITLVWKYIAKLREIWGSLGWTPGAQTSVHRQRNHEARASGKLSGTVDPSHGRTRIQLT